MSLAPGTRIGPYEVIAPLGAGGMGEVHRARDSRLGRDVAIKGLPAAFASHPERLARFEREARLLASLNHPNIAAIFGLEEAEGARHLVLELVEGETLAQRLARGPMPVAESLEVAGQIAAAIEAAHERGIVHRDLKPGNVMLTPARVVKVLDFGLAKDGATEQASSLDLSASPTVALSATGAGVILGTASYMSPEQARGHAVDRRADVWAFGCIAFELLCARQAFAGGTVSDVIARILEREPDWNALPPAAPARLVDVLRRCLTKDPEARPRDIGDLRRELASIAAELSSPSASRAAPRADKPSIAVLYFENLADDRESDYFCAGITEDILTDLSKLKGLRVASRNAVARYRGTEVDLAKVGAELNVSAVLEGSVRRAGDRVRISAQLVNAADGFHLWAERYDRRMDDVFAVQEEIAASIAEALRVALSPAETAAIAKAKPQDARAYDLYLRGRALYGKYTESHLNESIALFEQATQIDANYALAWAGIADARAQLCQWGRPEEVASNLRAGLEAARRALDLDSQLPEAHKAMASALRVAGDFDGARASLLRAVEADPRFTPALLNLCVSCFTAGDVAGAERFVRRALAADPQEAYAHSWLAVIAILTRRESEALATVARALELSSEEFYVAWGHLNRCWIHLRRGDSAAVEALLAEARNAGVRAELLPVFELTLALLQQRHEDARRAIGVLAGIQGLGAVALMLTAIAAEAVGEREAAAAIYRARIFSDLAPTLARLEPRLHTVVSRAPFAPARRDAALIWPLEAPMMEASVHALFREVRIESGLPEASATG